MTSNTTADSVWNDPRFAQGFAKSLRHSKPGDSPEDEPIVIYGFVEDTDDARFWKSIFSSLSNKYFKLKICCDENVQGKKKLLDMIQKKQLGPHKIVFIDSDFDYILQCPEVNNNKYVFQTYTHSIENHYYQDKNLYGYCCDVSEFHDDTVKFDFNNFFKGYSNTVYNLFVCMLCNCKNSLNGCKSESPLLHDKGKLKFFHLSDTIDRIKNEYKKELDKIKTNGERDDAKIFMHKLAERIISKLHNEINRIQLCVNCINDRKIQIQDELESLNITPDAIYFHINGHDLQDNVIKPLINLLVGDILIPVKRRSIKRGDRHQKYNTHLKRYQPLNDIKPYVPFGESIWSEKIKEDFQRFLSDPENCY